MTLLERLEASLAAAAKQKGQEPDMEAAAAAEAMRLREAAATEAIVEFSRWFMDGSEVIRQLWDMVEHAASPQLVDVLREVSDRHAGLLPTLALLQRHVEDTLGKRHGRGPITLDEDTFIAAVDRTAASTKWNVDDAWPAVTAAIRKAERLPIGDPEDGELEDDAAKVLRIVKALCGVSYLRVEVCKELGIDPDDYRTKAGYRWVVKLP